MFVASDTDVVAARQMGRSLAAELGFTGSDLTLIATAISEIARNMVVYAGRGEITISATHTDKGQGVSIVAQDAGPGIPDIEKAMRDGYSTGKTLGLGLPGARRIVDEFEITSEVGVGTTVRMLKWLRR